jgi:hypothetical protein
LSSSCTSPVKHPDTQHTTRQQSVRHSIRLALTGQLGGGNTPRAAAAVAAALVIHESTLTLLSHHAVGKNTSIYSLKLQNGTLHLLYTKPCSFKE